MVILTPSWNREKQKMRLGGIYRWHWSTSVRVFNYSCCFQVRVLSILHLVMPISSKKVCNKRWRQQTWINCHCHLIVNQEHELNFQFWGGRVERWALRRYWYTSWSPWLAARVQWQGFTRSRSLAHAVQSQTKSFSTWTCLKIALLGNLGQTMHSSWVVYRIIILVRIDSAIMDNLK